jgi:hypothetical protein
MKAEILQAMGVEIKQRDGRHTWGDVKLHERAWTIISIVVVLAAVAFIYHISELLIPAILIAIIGYKLVSDRLVELDKEAGLQKQLGDTLESKRKWAEEQEKEQERRRSNYAPNHSCDECAYWVEKTGCEKGITVFVRPYGCKEFKKR